MAITVKSGANGNSLDGLEGKTVCEVRAAFEGIWRIPNDATVQLNGRTIEDEGTHLRDGDEVSFMQATAQKG